MPRRPLRSLAGFACLLAFNVYKSSHLISSHLFSQKHMTSSHIHRSGPATRSIPSIASSTALPICEPTCLWGCDPPRNYSPSCPDPFLIKQFPGTFLGPCFWPLSSAWMLLSFGEILGAFRRSSVGMSNYSATIRSVPRFIRPADDSFICISASIEGRVEADLTKGM